MSLSLVCGVATSFAQQSQALNGQIQLGDIFAEQTLNVVDVSDFTVATTAASGNTFSAGVAAGSLDVTSTQELGASVNASTTLSVTGTSGEETVVTTAATGNDGEANVLGDDEGVLTGTFAQTVAGGDVTANFTMNAQSADTGALSASTQAVANSQGFGVIGGASEVFVDQANAGITEAVAAVELQYSPGPVTSSVIAVSNNVTAVGETYAEQRLDITQTTSGARTQASQYVATANAQEVTGSSSATSNNISIDNVGGFLNVVTDQTNDAYVRGEAIVTSYDFGAGSALASGVGNSVNTGNFGGEISIANTQTNNSSVETIARFEGAIGYDAYSTATAIGNGVTAYSCSDCAGQFNAANTQRNTASISAGSSSIVSGSGRSVSSTAAAAGNTATFYVSQPQ